MNLLIWVLADQQVAENDLEPCCKFPKCTESSTNVLFFHKKHSFKVEVIFLNAFTNKASDWDDWCPPALMQSNAQGKTVEQLCKLQHRRRHQFWRRKHRTSLTPNLTPPSTAGPLAPCMSLAAVFHVNTTATSQFSQLVLLTCRQRQKPPRKHSLYPSWDTIKLCSSRLWMLARWLPFFWQEVKASSHRLASLKIL